MTTTSPPTSGVSRIAGLRAGTLPLIGLVLIAALLPLRANWGVDLVLVGLVFTVPGVLALRAARVPAECLRTYPIYVPAASLLVMLAAGLACDLIAPLLGVVHPLHGVYTAVATLILTTVLWAFGIRSPSSARLPWAEILSRPSDLVLLLLAPLSALGALLLSSGHGQAVARVSILLDVAALLAGLLLTKRLGRRRSAILLFSLALALAWSWSLRGHEIIGFDISNELFVARHTQTTGVWHALHRNDAYGAMLSITVLPSVLKALCGVSPLIAFKLLFPVFAALLPVSIFLVGRRFLGARFAFGAACLLLTQNYFFQQLPELARQEVALVFFAALLASLLDIRLGRRTQIGLAVAMSLGLVVSHYSSTYLAIPLIFVALIARTLIARWRGLPLLAPALLCSAVSLGAGGALWYGAITHSSSNLTSFASSVQHKGLDILPSDGGALSTFLNGNNVRAVSAGGLERLAVRVYRRQAPYIDPLSAARRPEFRLRSSAVPAARERVPALSRAVSSVFLPVYNELLLVLLSLGTILMLLRRRGSPFVAEVGALGFGGLAFLLFIRISATAAAQYNETRALAQSLVILALPAAWLLERLVGRLSARLHRPTWVGLSLVVTLLFAQQCGAFGVILGGGTSLNLSASGEDFERYYDTPAEYAGARWSEAAAARSILYADRYGQLRLSATSGRAALNFVMPRTLDRFGWVYATRTNVQLHRARAQVNNAFGIYRWPAGFLDRYYNVVYDNGDSKVYHGG